MALAEPRRAHIPSITLFCKEPSMKCALIRLAAVSASCCLLAEGLAVPADAATPSAPTNVITIPSPDEVSGTFDESLCPWRMAYDAEIHSMNQATASSYAPLVAALCAMLGS